MRNNVSPTTSTGTDWGHGYMGAQVAECPRCGSTEAHTAGVVYRSGTGRIEATTLGGGVGFGGPAIASAHTTGSSQSLMALTVAPPKRPSHMLRGLFIYIVLLVLVVAVGFVVPTFPFQLMLVLAAAGPFVIGIWMSMLTRAALPEWRSRMEIWEATWVCDRCGTPYIPV